MNSSPKFEFAHGGRSAVLLGHPSSVFPQRFAEFFEKQAYQSAIVDRCWSGPRWVGSGIPALASTGGQSALTSRDRSLEKSLQRVEQAVAYREADRCRSVLSGTEIDWQPSFVNGLLNAVTIAPFVDGLRPTFVLGQEVFAYGLATALCRSAPKVLMPWGGDIYYFAHTSSVAFEMVRRALTSVDLILAGGDAGARYLVKTYGVSPERLHSFSWGVDTSQFRRALSEERQAFCLREGVPPQAKIIVNARRFHPRWGCDIALDAFRRIVKEDADVYCFMVGGGLSERHAPLAREQLRAEGLEARIRILDGHVPDAQIQELFSVADVFTSLLRTTDMRGSAILECAAAGAVPILSEVEEYRCMEASGLRALFVDVTKPETIMEALRRSVRDSALRLEVGCANREFILAHEDRAITFRSMLRSIEERIAGWRPEAAAILPEPVEVIRQIVAPYRAIFEPSTFRQASAKVAAMVHILKSRVFQRLGV